MNSQSIKTLLIILLIGAGSSPVAKDNKSTNGYVRIESASAAVTRALEYTGFKDVLLKPLAAAEGIAELIDGAEANLKTVTNTERTQKMWRVRLGPVKLLLSNWYPDWVKRAAPRNFTVFLDAETGTLLAIRSLIDSSNASDSVAKRCDVLLNKQGKTYQGTSCISPEISFFQAIDNAMGSDPLRADQIVGTCLVPAVEDGSAPQPIWIVTGVGIPVVGGYRFGPLETTVVSATSGEGLKIVNTPLRWHRVQQPDR